MTCREDIRLSGKPYPRSCPICKFGPCPRGHDYGKIKLKDQYAVVYENSYTEGTGYDTSTVRYETLKYFDTEQQLKEFLVQESVKTYTKCNIKRIIKFQELKATTTVEVTLV
jgi:hypothetical protein